MLDRNLEKWALLFFYVVLVLTMTVEVLRRELLAYSSIWGEEVVRYSFIYLVWIGAAAAVRDRAHIRIDVLLHYLGPRAKAMIYMFGDVVMFIVALIAFYWSFETVAVSWKFDSVSHGLRVSMVWILASVPIGFGLMIYRLAQSFINDLNALRAGKPVFEGGQMFD